MFIILKKIQYSLNSPYCKDTARRELDDQCAVNSPEADPDPNPPTDHRKLGRLSVGAQEDHQTGQLLFRLDLHTIFKLVDINFVVANSLYINIFSVLFKSL